MKNLDKLRLDIDKIDRKIDKLLSEREKKVLEINDLKKSQKLPIKDKTREKEIFSKLSSPHSIIIFKAIIRASREIQSSQKNRPVLNKKGNSAKINRS